MRRSCLMVLGLLSSACGRESTVVLDLVAAYPAAEKRLETGRIEFAHEDALGHLRSGWSEPELLQDGRTIVWAMSTEAELGFTCLRAGDRILEFAAQPFHYPGAPAQRLALALNGVAVGELNLERGWKSYQVPLAAARLRVGLNRLALRFAYARAPDDALSEAIDRRELAAALDWVQLRSLDEPPGGARAAPALRAVPAENALLFEGRAGVTYWVRTPLRGRLAFTLEFDPRRPPIAPARFEVRLRAPGSAPDRLYQQVLGSDRRRSRSVELPLVIERAGAAAIELETIGGDQDRDLGVRVRFPQIRRPAAVDPPPAVQPAGLAGLNLAVVLMDAGAAGHYSLYGYHRPTSPVLERLARESVVFERAYAEAPYTRAATATLFTGLYPEAHGAVLPLSRLPSWARSLPEIMGAAGLATGGFIANGNVAAKFGFGRGFQSFTEVMRLSHYDSYARSFWPVVDPWLDRQRRNRWFLYLHFREPHAYYLAPPGWLGRFSHCPDCLQGHEPVLEAINRRRIDFSDRDLAHITAQYDELIAWIDASIGALVERLRRRGLWQRTVLVVLSDHGEAFLEHGLMTHNYTVYDEMLRVVMMVRFPPVARVAARRLHTRVTLLDLLPTLAELAGAAVPERVSGHSLLPLMLAGDGALRPRPFEVARTSRQPPTYGVFDDDYKYVYSASRGTEELYDLRRDPQERNDIAAREPLLLGYFRQALKLWYLQQKRSRGAWESARAGEIDPELRSNLRALGYLGVGPDSRSPARAPGVDRR